MKDWFLRYELAETLRNHPDLLEQELAMLDLEEQIDWSTVTPEHAAALLELLSATVADQ